MDAHDKLTPEQLDGVAAGSTIVRMPTGKWMIVGHSELFDSYLEAKDHLYNVVWAWSG